MLNTNILTCMFMGEGGGAFLLLTKLLDVFIGSIAFKK